MVKWALMCATPVAVAGGAYLHGPFVWGTTYPLPSAQVASRLESMPIPKYFATTLASADGGSTRMTVPGQSVIYLFQARGGQAAKFIVDIKPIDAGHTKISTRMEMGERADALLKTQIMPGAKEFEVVGSAAMNEQIASKLSGRPFDEAIVQKAMMGFAVANLGEIQKGVADTLNESIKMADQQEADRVESHQPVIIPGQPMSDPGRPAH